MKNTNLSLKNILSGGWKNLLLTMLSVLAAGIIYLSKDQIQSYGLIGDVIFYFLNILTGLGALAGVKKDGSNQAK